MTVETQQDMGPDAQNAPQQNDDQKLLTQAQVNHVVQREKRDAYEKGKREVLEAMSAGQGNAIQPQPQQQMIGGMRQPMTPDEIKMMISQEAPKALHNHVQQLQTQNIANAFAAKMEAAESKYPGLRAKLEKLDFASAAPIIKAVNDTDNAADVMKELIIDNPMKLANLTTLAYTQPAILQEAVSALSDSIKRNHEALKESENQANGPLEPVTPSKRVATDNGQKDLSVSDLRNLLRKRRR